MKDYKYIQTYHSIGTYWSCKIEYQKKLYVLTIDGKNSIFGKDTFEGDSIYHRGVMTISEAITRYNNRAFL